LPPPGTAQAAALGDPSAVGPASVRVCPASVRDSDNSVRASDSALDMPVSPSETSAGRKGTGPAMPLRHDSTTHLCTAGHAARCPHPGCPRWPHPQPRPYARARALAGPPPAHRRSVAVSPGTKPAADAAPRHALQARPGRTISPTLAAPERPAASQPSAPLLQPARGLLHRARCRDHRQPRLRPAVPA